MENTGSVSASQSESVNGDTQNDEVSAGSQNQQENVNASEGGQEQKPRNVKKLKLKVDGQEVEEEIDLDDEEAIKRHLQMSKAAQKRMNEAAQTRRQAEQFIHMLKTNPLQVLTDPNIGVDFKKLAEEYLAEQIQNEMLSPEQRKIKEYEAQLRKHAESEKKAKEEAETQQAQQLQQHYAESYTKTITEALEKSGLPKTPMTVKRMAKLMSDNLNLNLDLDSGTLANMVREDYLSEIKELFGASDGDTLIRLLGDETSNKIRKADLARLKGAPSNPPPKAEPVRTEQPQRRQTTEEWLADARKRAMS